MAIRRDQGGVTVTQLDGTPVTGEQRLQKTIAVADQVFHVVHAVVGAVFSVQHRCYSPCLQCIVHRFGPEKFRIIGAAHKRALRIRHYRITRAM